MNYSIAQRFVRSSALFAVGFLVFAASRSEAQVTVSNVGSVPVSNVAFNQSSFDDASSVQARTTVGSLRGISQTFTWNSMEQLDGIGLRLATAQNTFTPFTSDQTWVLDIQQLSGTGLVTAASVVSTVASLTFTLPANTVLPNSYLYFDLSTNLSLSNGVAYGFTLYPSTSTTPGQALFFSRSVNSSVYALGVGAQTSGVAATSYGGQNLDFGFYLTTAAIPEPSTYAAVFGGLVLGIALLRKRR